MDACIAFAREALIEFPGNVKLMLALASALYNAGYVRFVETHISGDDGFSRYDVERHKTYSEWQEAKKLYESLLPVLNDGALRRQAVAELSQLYKNTDEHEKALQLAEAAPDLRTSGPFLKINAYDGKDAVAATGEALLETVFASAELTVQIVLSDGTMPPATAAVFLQNAIGLFEQVCPDGFAAYNGTNWAHAAYENDLKGRFTQPGYHNPPPVTDPGPLHVDYDTVQTVQRTVPPPEPYKTLNDENSYSPGRNDPNKF